jgi:toxin ParE1/3/4
MATYRLSARARRDLAEIWAYIADDSSDQADRFLESIVARLRILAQNPQIGRSRTELHPDLRSFPVREYLILYQARKGGIAVVRVVHGRRRLEALRYD